MQIFNNFNDFQKTNTNLADELLNHVKPGTWQINDIYLYDNPIDFAKSFVEDNIYIAEFNSNMNLHGAPSPFDYINYKAFSKDLINAYDPTLGYLTNDNHYIETVCGWDLK